MNTHYEMQITRTPKFDNHFNMVHYHSIYRVVKLVGDSIIEIVGTFDSPNGGWNYERAMQLMDELQREKING